MKEQKNFTFPKGFFWGASTAAHQVEGGTTNDWSEWEKSEKRLKHLKKLKLIEKFGEDNFISGMAADHYSRFDDDFKMAKEMGHNATRFSLEWSRIEPVEGEFDEKELDHYREVVRSARRNGLDPFVTVWHWPIPLWLRDKGGWDSKKMPKYFARYVGRVVATMGNDVKFWITLNEPQVYSAESFLLGEWPPQKRNLAAYLRVNRNLIRGHIAAYRTIKKSFPDAQIGIASHNMHFDASRWSLPGHVFKAVADWWWNFYFLGRINEYQDFVGVNHYFHKKMDHWFRGKKNEVFSDMGWRLHPESMYHVLMDLRRFGKPIYITENGLADSGDVKRPWFIVETLKRVHRAIENGADVRGYLHWSLMDNFEWGDGYWPRFGLVEIDYKTLERKMRPSAHLYRDICLENGVTEGILEKYRDLVTR